ncbi:hypothetical protein AN401_03965 [Zobellella denitrificans]|uniref:Uncharacterized protein n=1 Tax=Zobellella denitrificans TaxID=347534 RepID=A0A291HLY8_9GAMM|nr:hypothetical protein [Zobellella denitrificans]ATG73112.1 hypothetical protein AN401_03965 [Zobellella denitrificans]
MKLYSLLFAACCLLALQPQAQESRSVVVLKGTTQSIEVLGEEPAPAAGVEMDVGMDVKEADAALPDKEEEVEVPPAEPEDENETSSD